VELDGAGVPNTFFENFKRFEKYPDYTFAYEGTLRCPTTIAFASWQSPSPKSLG
jgi:hypothetical protein